MSLSLTSSRLRVAFPQCSRQTVLPISAAAKSDSRIRLSCRGRHVNMDAGSSFTQWFRVLCLAGQQGVDRSVQLVTALEKVELQYKDVA